MSIESEKGAQILSVAEEHLPAITELAGMIWRWHYPGIISREQIDYMLEKMYALETLQVEIRSQGIRFYQMVVDGRMAGFASIGPLETPEAWKLHKLYVLPELHGRGLGSRLLHYCEAEAGRLGARRLLLAVNKNNVRAIAAYQRNGFATIQSIVTDIGGGFVMDDFIMGKDLPGAGTARTRAPRK